MQPQFFILLYMAMSLRWEKSRRQARWGTCLGLYHKLNKIKILLS